MKHLWLFALLGAASALAQNAAQDQSQPAPAAPKRTAKTSTKKKADAKSTAQSATKPAAKPAPPVAQPLTIPADATANPDGTYSYTDKAGKQWIYSKTPFGVSKIQNTAAAPSGFTTTPKEQLIQTADQGDTVKFTRQTPFGPTTWEKKKSELTDEERTLYQSQHPGDHQ